MLRTSTVLIVALREKLSAFSPVQTAKQWRQVEYKKMIYLVNEKKKSTKKNEWLSLILSARFI
jgi:hypothetical protein